MAYYNTPGYYMPSMYGNQYFPQTNLASNSYAPPPQQLNAQGIIWVDGEVGAKAYQMPQGWPSGSPIALWDTNDTVIYLKSINPMGMPNQLQKIHYKMDEQPALQAGQMSGSKEEVHYATKEDLEQIKNEIRDMLKQNVSQTNQNGSQGQQNRGANR